MQRFSPDELPVIQQYLIWVKNIQEESLLKEQLLKEHIETLNDAAYSNLQLDLALIQEASEAAAKTVNELANLDISTALSQATVEVLTDFKNQLAAHWQTKKKAYQDIITASETENLNKINLSLSLIKLTEARINETIEKFKGQAMQMVSGGKTKSTEVRKQPQAQPLNTITTNVPPHKRAYVDKNTAGIIALLFGGLGVHRFLLNRPVSGIFYLIFCLTLIPLVISLIEAITLFTMSEQEYAAQFGYVGKTNN